MYFFGSRFLWVKKLFPPLLVTSINDTCLDCCLCKRHLSTPYDCNLFTETKELSKYTRDKIVQPNKTGMKQSTIGFVLLFSKANIKQISAGYSHNRTKKVKLWNVHLKYQFLWSTNIWEPETESRSKNVLFLFYLKTLVCLNNTWFTL